MEQILEDNLLSPKKNQQLSVKYEENKVSFCEKSLQDLLIHARLFAFNFHTNPTGTKISSSPSKKIIMGNLLYVIVAILLIAWLVGFIGFNAGGLIHVLLVIAIVVVLLRVIQGKKIV